MLLEIPKDCISYTIQGIEMQIIDNSTRLQMLQSDPEGTRYSECIMANGIFIAVIENDSLVSLYKVKGSPTNEMIRDMINPR